MLSYVAFTRPLYRLPVRISYRFASRASDSNASEEELSAARQWLAELNPETIPKSICDVSFSRSSGPGGQNVNKVNSKATMRIDLSSLRQHVPTILWPTILHSPYYATKSDALVIQSDDSRKQQENVRGCFVKLHDLLAEAGRENVPGETSHEQSQHVKKLQKAENENRLKLKKQHSNKKSARRGGGSSEY